MMSWESTHRDFTYELIYNVSVEWSEREGRVVDARDEVRAWVR